MTDRTAEQVRRWANELIDLSRRNSSLYFQSSDPSSKRRSGSSLEIVHPAPGPLLELLTRMPALDFFSPPPDGGVGSPWTVADSKRAAAEFELVTDRTSAADLRTTLRSLARQTNADDVDKGLQTLFIRLGMLVWLPSIQGWATTPRHPAGRDRRRRRGHGRPRPAHVA